MNRTKYLGQNITRNVVTKFALLSSDDDDVKTKDVQGLFKLQPRQIYIYVQYNNKINKSNIIRKKREKEMSFYL